jgi:hypothetical protein
MAQENRADQERENKNQIDMMKKGQSKIRDARQE